MYLIPCYPKAAQSAKTSMFFLAFSKDICAVRVGHSLGRGPLIPISVFPRTPTLTDKASVRPGYLTFDASHR